MEHLSFAKVDATAEREIDMQAVQTLLRLQPQQTSSIPHPPSAKAMEKSESSIGLFKITAALLLFSFAVIGGLLPHKLKNIGSKVVSCLNTGAGGVFLASAMVHMLPESSETLTTAWGDAFPWGEFMCTMGFLLILCTDLAVRICRDRSVKKSSEGHTLVPTEPPDNHAGHNHAEVVSSDSHGGDGGDFTVLGGVPQRMRLDEHIGEASTNGNQLGGEENGVSQHYNYDGRDVQSTGGSASQRPAPRYGFGYIEEISVIFNRYSGGGSNPVAHGGSHVHTADGSEGGHGHSHELGSPEDGVLLRVALLLALSVHSVMEGLGLGANASKAYNLLFAIGMHKGLAAYALGTSLLNSTIRFNELVGFIIAFALMTPLGILLGSLIERSGEDAPGATCVALASGTFLYVSLMEVLPPELDSTKHGWSKMASLLMGFSLSTLMGWIAG